MNNLRQVCLQGCPNEGGTRSLIWKILLNYLPRNRSQWDNHLKKRRNEYQEFIKDIIIRPGINANKKAEVEDHVKYFSFQSICTGVIDFQKTIGSNNNT